MFAGAAEFERQREEALANTTRASEPKVVCWFENVPAYMMFMDLSTQWRIAPMTEKALFGIDYAAVKAHLDIYVKGKKKRRRMYEKILILERGALAAHHDTPLNKLLGID